MSAATSRMSSSGPASGGGAAALAASETDVKRLSSLKRTEAVICNIGAMLAGVAVGFDVRANVKPRADVAAKFRPAGSEGARDPSVAAVGQQQHHTYHGSQTRYRPTVNFNLPIRFAESLSYDGDYCSNRSDSFTTPSSDHHTTPSADSRRTTPSLSGRSFFSADSSLQSPASNKPSVADSASFADLALISLSPSTDEAFVECQRQFSVESGGAVVDTSTWGTSSRGCRGGSDSSSVVQTPAGGSNYASPAAGSSYCMASDAVPAAPETEHADTAGSQCLAGIPSPLCPPPVMTRRPISHEQPAQAERPVTLDIIPRPRPLPGILKNVSPMHVVTPYSSPRSRVTPGSEGSAGHTQSPYHLANHHRHASLSADQRKTLLDIDAEGQTADSTKPLSVTRRAQEPDT